MLLQLALIGISVALLPLSIVYFSRDPSKHRKLVAVTVALTFELIMFGAFTRLTDSGLGCPDWPGCYGQANPLQSHADIRAAEIAMPSGPVTVQKAWIEMIHRYLAMSVGLLIIAQVVLVWKKRRETGISPWLATFLLFFVCLQGAFGKWTVTMKLQPVIVTSHLLLAMGLLALLAAALEQQRPRTMIAAAKAVSLAWPARIALILVFMQIALGGWVSTNYAALACHDYPLCQGNWMPAMDFGHGFSLWRQLGQTVSGEYLPFAALVAIHWVHRNFALLVLVAVLYAAWGAARVAEFSRLARYLAIVIGLQLAIGISTVFFAWPLLLAVLHNGGAAALVLLLSMLNYRVRQARRAVDD